MRMAIFFFSLCLIVSCSAAPVPEPPPPPMTTQMAAAVPAQVRAALERATPRENALAASPASDDHDIAVVRRLHLKVVRALDDLERDGGRQMTPEKIRAAQTAMRNLQKQLDKFAAEHKS